MFSISDNIEGTITIDPAADYECPALFSVDGDTEEVTVVLIHVTLGDHKMLRNAVIEAIGNEALIAQEDRVRDAYEAEMRCAA